MAVGTEVGLTLILMMISILMSIPMSISMLKMKTLLLLLLPPRLVEVSPQWCLSFVRSWFGGVLGKRRRISRGWKTFSCWRRYCSNCCYWNPCWPQTSRVALQYRRRLLEWYCSPESSAVKLWLPQIPPNPPASYDHSHASYQKQNSTRLRVSQTL